MRMCTAILPWVLNFPVYLTYLQKMDVRLNDLALFHPITVLPPKFLSHLAAFPVSGTWETVAFCAAQYPVLVWSGTSIQWQVKSRSPDLSCPSSSSNFFWEPFPPPAEEFWKKSQKVSQIPGVCLLSFGDLWQGLWAKVLPVLLSRFSGFLLI